jgi:hypothetical protein
VVYKTFLLSKKNNSGYLKGWVIHPQETNIITGDPLQVTINDSNVKIWIVMMLGIGIPPKAIVKGEGMDTQIEIENMIIKYDQNKVQQLIITK